MWTRFTDMHSGGGCKEEPYEYIFIEACVEEAKTIFFKRFGHDPEDVTCMCCGSDYSISEFASLKEATKYGEEKYAERGDVLVIHAEGIKAEERTGDVPQQGYIWQD